MIYNFIKKFKKVICLVILCCIVIPLVSACGENENKLKVSVKNSIIGVGTSIDAYTTYSQAKFLEMDKNMYYSYLLSYRDFILVVLPEDASNKDYPNMENFMFQAAYNGVTPYADKLINGNFTFKSPEYKLVIYYVLANEFLEWEKDANKEADKSFVGSALDFMGPSDADNYEINIELQNGKLNLLDEKVIRNEEEYNLKNIVNKNKYVSECDFLRVDDNYNIANYEDANDTIALNKCGSNDGKHPKGKNVVADVARGASGGVTLLFGSGGLSGYFTYEQVGQYNFDNVSWIKNLLSQYDNSMSKYVKSILSSNGISGDEYSDIETYANRMEFKFKYDLALLGRIKKINYNTLLDINTTTNVTTGLTSFNDRANGENEYVSIIEGSSDYNNGNYIAFTTADGFILDRGNIVMQAGEDFLFNTNFLEALTQIDACTNRTLGSYIAEILATTGIITGAGLAVGGAALLTAGILAKVGIISTSIPGVGWIVGGVALLAAGALALYAGIATKKSINDTNSADFCEVFKEAMEEIVNSSYIKLPIYTYNIKEDSEYTTELCYEDYYDITTYDANGNAVIKKTCGSYDKDGVFKKAGTIPAFKMANVETVEKLDELSGAPSIRLYSKGKLVDEIYGAASAEYVYAIMDSWGVTSAANMKFYSGIEMDNDTIKQFSIYDLMYTNSQRNTTISSALYCVTLKYGESCTSSNGIAINGLSYNKFNSGIYTSSVNNSSLLQKEEALKNYQISDLKAKYEVTADDIVTYKNSFLNELQKEGGPNKDNIEAILDNLNNLFLNDKAALERIETFRTKLNSALIANNGSIDQAINIVNDLDSYLVDITYYNNSIPLYFTVTIVENDSNGQEIITSTSTKYKNFDISFTYTGGN